ncbi:uncharacterized protein BT62DRAFT_1073612 [Guyanagaster necrorhizus]|uniref:Uncharacterized protein n=1 Tax=Guyanagaster necrorhizus TaxID=856835 RepID=A0A9P7VYI9_9AGAR|nr:uncharacterized protein BT62DRAFT_1073612 [Guyanagaster necrorhizus MCA 3950]KAG7449080.1 hypothetical protein BT62DRAFT_1073612 [Guyanagaster necrorhizus MCA 3950]
MTFRPRNPYYLRISERHVLPLYLYLDDRHLDWMSDRILQHVLEDLRPIIVSKLRTESELQRGSNKNGTVETHRGEAYQFCYFLRKAQPHSVLLKSRTFITASKQLTVSLPAAPPSPKSQKRKPNTNTEKSRKKPKTKGKGRAKDDNDNYDEDVREEAMERPTRRSRRNRQVDEDVAMDEDSNHSPPDSLSLELEIGEEEKPKPMLRVGYQGFDISELCLCIVVEPCPPIRMSSIAPPFLRARSQTPALTGNSMPPPPVPEANTARREKTPLFLPDEHERERRETPAPFPGKYTSVAPPSHGDDDDDGWGMMEFSQVLNAVGDSRAGAIDEDEDMDGAVFFGDADEVKEL